MIHSCFTLRHDVSNRRSRQRRVTLQALWFVLLAGIALLPASEGLTLDKAVEVALAANPEVMAARTEVKAARGRTLQLRARPEPRLAASVEGVPLSGAGEDRPEAEFSLGIEQVFEYPGKRALRSEIGRLGESLAEAELARLSLVVAARVKRAYWQAVFARDSVRALEKSLERLDLLLSDLQVKYGSGTAAYADVLRARAERARLRNQIIEQEKERRRAALELNELLARPAGDPVELLSPMTFAPLAVGPEALWESARSTRSSRRLTSLRKEQAEIAVKLARLDRRPDLLAGFSLPSTRAGAWGLSLGLTLPFLRPGRSRGVALEAGAVAENAGLMDDALTRSIRSALENAYSSARAAQEQVQVFEQGLLRDLDDELRIQLEYFRYGRAEVFSILDLHRTYVLAELEHLRAVLLFNLALADLEVAGEEFPGWRNP
jgi:cobalt-zinc-cadmium efflux system outer membrane protein